MAIRKGATRITATVDKDTVTEIDLLAKKRDMKRSEWLAWAVNHAISESHNQFSLAGIEAQRLNQLQQSIVEMTHSQDNLSDLIIDLVHMMNTLMSGESYLNDADENSGK